MKTAQTFRSRRTPSARMLPSVEAGDGETPVNPIAVAAGIEFIDENGGGPGVRLKKSPKRRT